MANSTNIIWAPCKTNSDIDNNRNSYCGNIMAKKASKRQLKPGQRLASVSTFWARLATRNDIYPCFLLSVAPLILAVAPKTLTRGGKNTMTTIRGPVTANSDTIGVRLCSEMQLLLPLATMGQRMRTPTEPTSSAMAT